MNNNIVKSNNSTLYFERSEKQFNLFYIVHLSSVIGTINMYKDFPKPNFFIHRQPKDPQIIADIMSSILALKKACHQC